ncbi:MAG: transglutaminase domain-containing protein [Dehalococcoidales bacterium]|nr:transglutaminase domain-containing protein [Dehalococcoidales bacterium]
MIYPDSLSSLAKELYIGEYNNYDDQAKQAVVDYEWVKDNVLYRFSYWGVPGQTLFEMSGASGAKSELLGELLELHGISAQYMEGRPLPNLVPLTRVPTLNSHFWVEARIGKDWLTLDPTPDSGLVHLLGDTSPGTHLIDPKYIGRWNKIPDYYRKCFNHPLLIPARYISNLKLAYYRRQRAPR